MKKLTIGGAEYKLPAVDLRLATDFLTWAKPHLPSALDALASKIAAFPPHLQEVMVREAMKADQTPKNFDSPEVRAVLTTPHGASEFVRLLFTRHHPDLTAEQAWELHEKAVEEHGQDYLRNIK